MGESTSNLSYVIPNFSLGKGYVLLYTFFDQQLKVTFLSPLHSNKQFIQFVVDEPIQVADDVFLI